jgi:hypothetical protein
MTGIGRSETVADSLFSIRRGLISTQLATPIGGGIGAQSQVVENVGNVPAPVDNTDNLDDAGTLTVEDQDTRRA